MKPLSTVLLLGLFFSSTLSAQITNEWSHSFGSTSGGADRAYNIYPLADSSVIITGEFSGQMDVDPGPGVVNTTGSYDSFILKLDSNGDFVWVKTLEGSGGWPSNIYSLTTDSSGNIFCSGIFPGTVDFDPGPGVAPHTANANANMFVLKLDSYGNFLWVQTFDQSTQFGMINPTYIEAVNDDLYMYGRFEDTVDFDPGPGVNNMGVSADVALFVLKMSGAGNVDWVHSFGSSIWNNPLDLAVNSNEDVYVVGTFGGTIDFETDGINSDIYNTPSIQYYMQKLDSTGDHLWVRTSVDINYTQIEIGELDEVYIGGDLWAPYDFDTGPAEDIIGVNGQANIFIQKLSNTEDHLWVGSTSEIGSVSCNDKAMTIDMAGNAYYLFRVFGTGYIDVDPLAGIHEMPTTPSVATTTLFRWDSEGNLNWGAQTDGLVSGSLALTATPKVSSNGDVYLFFNYENSIDVGLVGTPDMYTSSGGIDFVVARYNQLPCSNMTNVTDVYEDISCVSNGYISTYSSGGTSPYSYEWTTGATTNNIDITASGLYALTASDAVGCLRSTYYSVQAPLMPNSFDLNAHLIAGSFQPSIPVEIFLDAFNDGCVLTSGEVTLIIDTSFVVYDSSYSAPQFAQPYYVNGDTLKFLFPASTCDSTHLTALLYFTTNADTTIIGDTLQIQVQIDPVSGDFDPVNNSKTYNHVVVSAYDPNDKQAYPAGNCPEHYIQKGSEITYTVRFQNTGTAAALNVVIIDTLSHSLDLSTLSVLGHSHPGLEIDILQENVVQFRFDSILLPPEIDNEALSHGYVIFRIDQKSNTLNGALIENEVGIYFDINAPIITNTVFHTVATSVPICSSLGIQEIVYSDNFDGISIYPNPTDGLLTIRNLPHDVVYIVLYDQQGRRIAVSDVNNSSETVIVDFSGVTPGMYYLQLGEVIKSLLIK